MKRVNLGCGEDYRDGWINVDINEEFRPDDEGDGEFIRHDLHETPWSWAGDNEFTHLLVDNVFEHIAPPSRPDFLSECRRILEDGGTLVMKLPTHVGWDVSHYSVPPWYWAYHPRQKEQWRYDEIRLRKNVISKILPKKIALMLLKYDVIWAAREVELRLK